METPIPSSPSIPSTNLVYECVSLHENTTRLEQEIVGLYDALSRVSNRPAQVLACADPIDPLADGFSIMSGISTATNRILILWEIVSAMRASLCIEEFPSVGRAK